MRDLPLWIDVLAAALVVVGVVFALVGSLGLAKLSDFLKRLHGPTKASTLGVGCVLIASMLYFAGTGRPALHELLITLFVFLTAPVSAHLLVKAAMRLDPRLRPPDPPAVTEVTPRAPKRDAGR
jgi:multicomponent K+:H+ antiporter subunit G